MKILIVVGTRPNFIKVTQFKKAASMYSGLTIKLVHTGQHYDTKMSGVFFEQLRLQPDYFLQISQGTPIQQMAEIMTRLEKLVQETYMPDMMIVPGDVNTTVAAALVANKMNIRLAHLEAGLRSFDRTMPEEFNRILTDIMADLYFVTEQSAIDNLKQEGVSEKNIHFVGNTMIDTLLAFQEDIERSPVLENHKLEEKKYILMTIHRPSTVDTEEGLKKLIALISGLTKRYSIMFPVHPRTINNLKKFGLYDLLLTDSKIILCDPLDYFSFQKLIKYAKFVLTDSGGIQEETTYLQIPCLTLRSNTERPVTVSMGTNELVPFDVDAIKEKITSIEKGTYKSGTIPPHWDGKSTQRIIDILKNYN